MHNSHKQSRYTMKYNNLKKKRQNKKLSRDGTQCDLLHPTSWVASSFVRCPSVARAVLHGSLSEVAGFQATTVLDPFFSTGAQRNSHSHHTSLRARSQVISLFRDTPRTKAYSLSSSQYPKVFETTILKQLLRLTAIHPPYK